MLVGRMTRLTLPRPAARGLSRSAACGAALLIYAAVSLVLFGQNGSWSTTYRGMGPDPICFIWFLHWWPYAIHHGLNPFITNAVWVPHGFNLTWATSVPFPALVMAPVTYFFGPVVCFNLLTLAAPALAAWTAFLLCEYVTDDWLAALFGGYLYGFSSYELGQLLGHFNLDFICLVPVVLLLCIRRVRGDMSAPGFIAALTACLLAELGIATEILASLCLFGAVSWAVFLHFAAGEERARMWRLAQDIAVTAVITIILASPFLYYMAKGFADVPAQINAVQAYVTDPRNFFFPTIVTYFSTPYLLNISGTYDGNASEQGAYLGLPLILLVAVFFAARRHQPYVKPLALVTLLLILFTLGPHLQIGLRSSHVLLPWELTRHVPLIGELLPSRFTMYIALSTGIAAALALATARGPWRWVNYGLAVAACIVLYPNRSILSWWAWPSAPFLTAENVRATLGKLPNVLVLPFADAGPGMAWQLNARMSFQQTGGYVGFVPATEKADPAFAELRNGLGDAASINALQDLCVTHHVQYILLAPNTPPALSTAILALHWPVRVEPGVTIVTVPPAASLDYYTMTGDYWPSPAKDNWMGRQITIVTHQSPVHVTLSGAWTRPSPTLRMSVTNGTQTNTYPVTRSTVIPIDIPPHSTVTISANKTWVPDRFADPRHLSVTLELAGN